MLQSKISLSIVIILWSLGTEICLTVLEDVKERGMHPLHAHIMLEMLDACCFTI